jgi:hypothetical protein
MAIYRTSLRMAHDATWNQRKRWTTTFHVQASTAAIAAQSVADAWDTWLRDGTSSIVFAYEVYATDLLAATSDYEVVPIPAGVQRGKVVGSTATSERYLGKACATVTLSVPGSRPSRKFWRFGFTEADVVGGTDLTGPVQTAIGNAFGNFITAMSGALVDPDGQPITSVRSVKFSTRNFGRQAGSDLPLPPAVG